MTVSRFTLAAVALLALAVPATAAGSRPTAYPIDPLPVYNQPWGPFRTLLFTLAGRERVYVLSCTYESRACQIQTLDGKHKGWVDGSYLVGSGAKNAVTPMDFGFPPIPPGFLHPHP